MSQQPKAFLSYAHIDDEWHGGAISELRRKLSMAVRVITGQEFPIFQDREDISWGQQWRETLTVALREVRFLIPIITPNFFQSEECRKELEQFISHEELTGRNDLILPIYYIDCVIAPEAEQCLCGFSYVIMTLHFSVGIVHDCRNLPRRFPVEAKDRVR